MSKIHEEKLRTCILSILSDANNEEKKRNFVETVEVQITIRNYDSSKDKRFAGSVKLPYMLDKNYPVCILGDAYHIEEASKAGYPYKTLDDVKILSGKKKDIKKFIKSYRIFLASESVHRQLARIAGSQFTRAGKFPTPISQKDSMTERVNEAISTIKIQYKKSPCFGYSVGTTTMEPEKLIENTSVLIKAFVLLLKKKWSNVGSIHIKSTMGSPHRIY